MRRDRLTGITSLAVLLLAGSISQGEPPGRVQFSREIRPILADRCFACHGPDKAKRKAGLRLDTAAGATADLGGYAAIVPGDPQASELVARINADDDDVMPPPRHPKRLSREEKQLLARWIEQGARYEGHWAYVRPTRPPLPAVRDASWPRNPLDRFVLAAMEAHGLAPSEEADRATLIRRLSLDLTGLPPTVAQVDAFLADSSADAYTKLVDRLLASAEFGTRWARPWLDLARYADSHGFQRDDFRDVWAYRDWVIAALNRDMPFDRFTIEQLAGDLLPGASRDQLTATGFHRCLPANIEAGTEPEESRINQVFDRVNTTATVWLGITIECARCHDHKFDPISQKEYYRLLAFFNNTDSEVERSNPKVPSSIQFRGPALTIGDDSAIRPQREQLEREVARLDKAIEELTRRTVAAHPEWEPRVRQSRIAQLPEMARLKKSRTRAQRDLKALQPPSTQVMHERALPRTTTVFRRGEYTDPGEPVQPGVPAVLHSLPAGPPNRLTLARWLVAPENPLTARVTVNRFWAELFGRGLVATPEDFGMQGDLPSHPELLDWLAVQFVENGWSTKRLLRAIVTSATYRQSSRATPERLERDPTNRWLARGARFRMDAEMIRDNALAVAGLLSLEKGGPPIRPPQPEGLWKKVGGQSYEYAVSPGSDRYRRGVYIVIKRGAPYPGLAAFDATARMTCAVNRARSNTPLQALTLLNDPVYVEAAQALARRIVRETPRGELVHRLVHAYRLALARTPSPAELEVLRTLYESQRTAHRQRAPAARTAAGSQAAPPGPSQAEAEAAAWFAVASAVMNLDATITRD
jgi:hypothetical protein